MSNWVRVGKIDDVPAGGGACAMVNDKQIAIFANEDKTEWYAVDNLCPHQQQMVLSRGLMGCDDDHPKVACPLHKHSFSLRTGQHMAGDISMQIEVFPIEIRNKDIFIKA